ncbi:MAG: NeuD/PglB/VioB family sugar acetyltransferase [Patescibacteria group bacterium]
MSDAYVIYGCGGHARSVAEVILYNQPDAKLTFVDDAARPDEKIFGFDVVADSPASGGVGFVALGDNLKRQSICESLGDNLTQVIAKDAHIGRDTELGAGCFVGHEAYTGPLVSVGEASIINTRAIVEHEVKIGRASQICPGVIIGGRTTIGDNVFVGLGATIIDGITICSDVIIGAGAVVVNNIDQPGTYVGVPARRIDG